MTNDGFMAGWWYAIAKYYGVREVLGGRSNVNASPLQRLVGPVYAATEDDRDMHLSAALFDMPLETRVSFQGPFETEDAACAAMGSRSTFDVG